MEIGNSGVYSISPKVFTEYYTILIPGISELCEDGS